MTVALIDVVLATRVMLIVLFIVSATIAGVYWYEAQTPESRHVLAGIAAASVTWACFYSWLVAIEFVQHSNQDTLVTLVARLVHFPTIAVFTSVAILTHRREVIRKAVSRV